MDTAKPPKRLKVLFADDEVNLQELISHELPRLGHEVTVCPDGATAVAALEMNHYDCIIVDLDMPKLNGIDVIGRAKQLSPDTECVILTGKSTVESAIAALRHGAFDYLTKPCRLIEIKTLLLRIAERLELTRECRALRQRVATLEGSSELIGSSPVMQRVRQRIQRVAPTESSVLILGETGTGKELVARAIHRQSPRAERPFVAINCGALPENLIESELFGHRKGAFTGADEHRTGLFEVADGGTLFLDELGELPKSMQAKLLRVLESGEIRRVGDNHPLTVDVRVVCATHRDLERMVAEGAFREDLMFRINTFEILIPPLRERGEDVVELAQHLAARHCPAARRGEGLWTTAALDLLRQYAWPGNVRELANAVEHATILCDAGPIRPEDLPSRFAQRKLAGPHFKLPAGAPQKLKDLELNAIHQALERHQGNKQKAADELGINVKTLYNKLNAEQDRANEPAA